MGTAPPLSGEQLEVGLSERRVYRRHHYVYDYLTLIYLSRLKFDYSWK